MAFHTKVDASALQGALKGLERGIQKAFGWYWVKNFLRHQKNDCLNPENPAHRQIIALLLEQSERFPASKAFLPKGASKPLRSPIGKGKGKGEGNEHGEEPQPSPLQVRIGKLLGRRESTAWSDKELDALKKIKEPTDEDWEQIERFYAADIPKDDFRRTTIQVLLNNWTGELDKARIYSTQNP